MPKIKIPKEDIDIITEGKRIDSRFVKHDVTSYKYLFEKDGKHYTAWLDFSYNDGLQLWYEYVEATEVKEVEVVTKKWVPVD